MPSVTSFEINIPGLEGEIFTSETLRTIYSTDASAYKEKPLAVALPRSYSDIQKIIQFANQKSLSLIPRTAGTSIAGQVVGNGIIVDVSKHLNKILELNTTEKWVRVQPGVVLDELNIFLKKHGLFFGPETSTSNRCMMGGMVGNNSCGAHSLVYGSTRDHVLELHGFLSDGSEASFQKLSKDEFLAKCEKEGLEGNIYRNIRAMLSQPENQQRIRDEFPDPRLERRNTGYAIDLLLETEPFTPGKVEFNFCKLLAGSEGTLFFTTEIKLNLVDLPPSHTGLLVVHLETIAEALEANILALKHKPVAIELIDNFILECTKTSREHSKNRFFIEGEPGALLCIEFSFQTKEEINRVTGACIAELKENGYGYHFPVLLGADISKVWALRKAGLGLLSNIPGDAKPVPVIEDTAVIPEFLPAYIRDFNEILKKLGLQCVYYAHVATGELHLRPVINLKTSEGIELFRKIAYEIAILVKKYKGSISGEHGDGRLRGEFIPLMIGEQNYALLRDLKSTWDPKGIFNKGKITDTPPMNSSMRFVADQSTPEFDTVLDFSDTHGLIRMAENCNGSADCRKSQIIGGTMCPSYQALRDEDTTTRARANMLREILNKKGTKNPFDNKDLYEVLDLCLSCKGCKTECPSGVDMAKLKAEFLHQYYKSNPISIRTRLIANFSKTQALASMAAGIYNRSVQSKAISSLIKRVIGFAEERSLPLVSKQTFRKWLKNYLPGLNRNLSESAPQLYLFVDEFTNYNDTEIGITTVKLLNALGYKILVLRNADSGRTFISKGFLPKAKKLAQQNVNIFSGKLSESVPLVGIEPSAILTFRDEYPDLLRGEEKAKAVHISKLTFTIEEFLAKEIVSGKITSQNFTKDARKVIFHGHCQQKAISSTLHTRNILQLPENYVIDEIKSGCCGMAGSFGFEKEHFNLSMKVGELVLLPAVRKADAETIVVASGTSCRHQIKDGTEVHALHPVEVLYRALSR